MIINALNSGASVFMADFEDSNSPTWRNNVEGQINLRDAVERNHQLHQSGREELQAGAEHGRADGAAPRAGTWTRNMCWWTASRSRPACSISGCISSTTRATLIRNGTGPYFYLPKLESHLEARLWNDVFLFAQDELGISARHHPRHRADRDNSRRLRDGRDPLRTARAFRRAQLRPLGLHLQLHQEVPEPPGMRAAGPRRGHHGPALPELLRGCC